MAKPTCAFLNGHIVPIDQAHISVLDRGFLFADGVYEVTAVIHSRLVDNPAHMARLKRSLDALQLTSPIPLDSIPEHMRRLVRHEQLEEGLVYLQITRGSDTQRAFGFPNPAQCPATLVMFAQDKPLIEDPIAASGAKVITIPDLRWRRRDIKSIALLPQVLGKQAAIQAGAFEAWMIEDGYITEGTSSAAAIITHDHCLVTRPTSSTVLDSITRRAILRLVAQTELTTAERRFTVDDAYAAAEAFMASATALITGIIEIDGRPIGDGRPGPWTQLLRAQYLETAASEDPILAEFP